MSHKIEKPVRYARTGGRMASLIDVRISELKRQLEERLSHSSGRADWQEMLEDCEIILSHLGRQPAHEKNPIPRALAQFTDARPIKDSPRHLER